jgi:beta-lactamase superfamily II metal-dependent hydrolase
VNGITVLKAGHHGSRFSTGEELLQSATPRCALISCGAGNNFGHPNLDVIRRLTHAGATIYRTDQQGAVHVVTDGETVSVETCEAR